jgi:hypothetical protein
MSGKWSGAILFLGVLCVAAGVGQAQAETKALIGYWKFEGNLSDSAGKNNGTFTGGPPAYVAGQVGQAISFDGVDDFVNLPSPVNPAAYSIAVWVKPARPDPAGIVTRTSANGPTTEWSHQLRIQNGVFHHYLWVGAERNLPGTTTVSADTWYHVVIVAQNNGPMRLYVNGKEDAPSIGVAGTLWAGGDRLHIGSNSGHGMGWFKGLVDDLRIYNRELSAAQVADLYNGIPPAFVKAENPIPADGAVGVSMPLLQWTKGETAVFHDVYLGTSPDLTAADLQPRPYSTAFYYTPELTPGLEYFWRVDEIEGDGTVHTGDLWHFTATPLTAYLPQPADGAVNVLLNPTLSWAPGLMATAHHLYFGPDRQAVEAGTGGTDKGSLEATETSYQITEALKVDARYFWRIDETDSANVTHTGPTWSFETVWPGPTGAIRQWWLNTGGGTTVADLTGNGAYPDEPTGSEFVTLMEGPVDWADNYGTRLYGWVYPSQSGDYTFWIASDDNSELWLSTDDDPANKELIASVASWTASREWTKEANQQSLPVALEAGQRYYIEALQKEGSGGDNIAVAWQGPGIAMDLLGAGGVGPTPYLPQKASNPFPADGAVDTVQSLTLTWNAGEKALQHEVYFGDDANAVAAADTSSDLFQGRQSGTRYDTGALEWGKTFFWRVDEINEGETESPWVGRVWSFSTANFIPVDDFESYNDVEGTDTRIYETWIDGYADGSSGSIVGNLQPPFAERTIVHGGRQSMPMDYNNIDSPYFSEAYREFSPLMNWMGNGVTDLSLWVRGWPAQPAVNETAPGAFTVSGSGIDIWSDSDQFTFVYKTLNGDGVISARVVSNGTGTNSWAKGGVMIRDNLTAGSVHAHMDITGGAGGGNGASFQARLTADSASLNSDSATVVTPPYWIKLERRGDTFTGFLSPDGVNWTPQGDPQYIPMSTPAYVGLCVTSHAPTEYRTFQFDNVTVTGAAGSWQAAEVGFLRNSPQSLYVIVEDSANKRATVTNATAVNATEWTEWKIPLTDLQSVNLAKVKRMYIGVGDTANPTPDGTGRIYIDDIRVTRP